MFPHFPECLAQKFDTDFMLSLPDHPALPTGLRPSCQMQSELLTEVIDVTDRQARTYLT